MKRKSEGGNKPSFVKRKTELVFDAEKRSEFLTGFHKRKLHRKKVAQNDIQRKLKEDVRRIRTEAKEKMKNLYHSYKPIPELTAEDKEEEQEYDTENVTVKVVELSTTELAKQNNWIGENRAVTQDDDEESESSSEEEDNALGTIPGMELDGEKPSKKKKADEEEEAEQNQDEEKAASGKQKPRGPVLNLEGIHSKKELNRKLKRHAQKSIQKSKAFQQSVRAQQQKQLKKSRRVKHVREKQLKKRGKLQGGRNGKGGKRGGGRGE